MRGTPSLASKHAERTNSAAWEPICVPQDAAATPWPDNLSRPPQLCENLTGTHCQPLACPVAFPSSAPCPSLLPLSTHCPALLPSALPCPAPQFFSGTTGYGHSDAGGREGLDRAFAEIMGAEAALVRPQVSGSSGATEEQMGGELGAELGSL